MGCLVLYWNNVPKVKWRHDDKTLKGLAGLAKTGLVCILQLYPDAGANERDQS